jgi:hypothetical protein
VVVHQETGGGCQRGNDPLVRGILGCFKTKEHHIDDELRARVGEQGVSKKKEGAGLNGLLPESHSENLKPQISVFDISKTNETC